MPPKQAIPNRRKRTAASFRREALKRLKEKWEGDSDFDPAGEPTVTPVIKSAEGGIPSVLHALRAHDNEDARKFVELYDSLSAKDRQYLTLEEIAYAAGIGSLRLSEIAQSGMIMYGQMSAKMMIASSMHRVTQSIVKAATDEVPITAFSALLGKNVVVGKTNGDTKAMELFGKISGMVPVPKGSTVNFNNIVAGDKDDDEDEARPEYLDAGDRLRMIHDAVDPKRLPSPPSTPIDISGRLSHMQDDVAEVLADV